MIEYVAERSGGRINDLFRGSSNEEKAGQEYETSEGADSDTVDHDLWAFYGGVGDLLYHVSRGVESVR